MGAQFIELPAVPKEHHEEAKGDLSCYDKNIEQGTSIDCNP